jgi:hypothetical protein
MSTEPASQDHYYFHHHKTISRSHARYVFINQMLM